MKMRTMRKTREKKRMMSVGRYQPTKTTAGRSPARWDVIQFSRTRCEISRGRRWTPPRCSNLPCNSSTRSNSNNASPDSSPDSSGIQRPFAPQVSFYTSVSFFRLLISRTGPDRRYDQSADGMRRSQYDDGMRASSQVRTQYDHPPVGASRQNIFSSVLDAGRNTGMPPPDFQNNNRDTFVQIESPAETMTKHSLRRVYCLRASKINKVAPLSVKRRLREKQARPSSMSRTSHHHRRRVLLGAISAHERERNGKAGWAPLLTEREREKRIAEERQRKLDDFQRQQLDLTTTNDGARGIWHVWRRSKPTDDRHEPDDVAILQSSHDGIDVFQSHATKPGCQCNSLNKQQCKRTSKQCIRCPKPGRRSEEKRNGRRESKPPRRGSPAPMSMMGAGNMPMGIRPENGR